jgi:hypothetical protein
MRFTVWVPFALGITISTVIASPHPALATVRNDKRCGNSFGGAVCGSSECCSQYGWCGITVDHCGGGCLPAFGKCTSSTPTPKISTDGTCGSTKGYTCQLSRFGNCCSTYGWCGSSADYCSSGCRSAFGSCNGVSSSRSSSTLRSSTSIRSSSSSAKLSSTTRVSTSIIRAISSSVSSQRSSSSNTRTLSASVQTSSTSRGPSPTSSSYSSHVSSITLSDVQPSNTQTATMVPSSAITRSTTTTLAQTSSTAAETYSSSSRLDSSASSSSLPTSLSSSSFQSTSSSVPVPMTLVPTSTSTSSVVPTAPLTRDPLEDPTYFTFVTTSNQISGIYVTVNDAHNGNTCLRVTSTDANGAVLNAEAAISVQAGTRYQVTLWIRSLGGGCSASVHVNGIIIASSDGVVPTTWTAIQGFYTANINTPDPTLTLSVSCPAIVSTKRQAASAGMEIDDVTMNVEDPNDVTSLPPSSIPSSATSSSIIEATSTPPPLTITSLASLPASSTSALSCRPTIIDPSFELSGVSASSSDWEIGDYNPGGDGSLAVYSNPYNLYHYGDGLYSYFVYSNSTQLTTYTFRYLHPLSLCAGVPYQLGYWTRGYRYRGANTNGCHVDAYLNNEKVFWDRVGRADNQNWRYVGGKVTFAQDVFAAGLELRFSCPPTKWASNNRGVM